MNILWEYPPYPFLELVALHYPNAVWLYLQLWKRRDRNNRVKIGREEIQDEFLISATRFIGNLRMIARENLLNFEEKESLIFIEFIDWQDVENNNEE